MVRLSAVPAVSWIIRVTSFPGAIDVLVESIRNTTAVREVFLVSDMTTDHEVVRQVCREKKIRFESSGQSLDSVSLSNLVAKVTSDYLVLTEGALWLMPQWDEALVQELVQRKIGLVSGVLDCQQFSSSDPPLFSEFTARGVQFLKKNGSRFRRGLELKLLMWSRDTIETNLTRDGVAFDPAFSFNEAILDGVLRLSAIGQPLIQAGSCWGIEFENPVPSQQNVQESKLFFQKWARTPSVVEDQLKSSGRSCLAKIRSIFGYI